MVEIIGLLHKILKLSKRGSLFVLFKLEDPKLVLARHSCEGRNPGLFESRQWRDWIPAYAGMTEKQLFQKPNLDKGVWVRVFKEERKCIEKF